MSTNTPPSLSLAMLLANLKDAVEAHTEAKAKEEQARHYRDTLIRDLVDGGIPKTKIARIAKLSREQIYNIQHDGRDHNSDA